MEVLFRAEMLSSNYPKNENECFKFIDNNWYVIGKDNTIENFELDGIELCSIVNKYGAWIGKKDTKAINFENILDSQGNKIFVSLSKNGKGGDVAEYTNRGGKHIGVYMFSQRFTFGIHLELENKTYITVDFEDKNDLANFKVIGIQK